MKRFKDSYLAYLMMYLFYYLAWALFSALISVYLLDLGYKASQVSLVVSSAFIASMLSQPAIGWLNDRLGIKKVTSILLAMSIPGGILMILSHHLLPIIVAYSWMLLLVNGCSPVMEKIATNSPFSYGKIRIWGTIGYALGSQVAGMIYDYISPKAIFLGFIISMVLSLVGIWGTQVAEEIHLVKAVDIEVPNSARQALFRNKRYLFYLILAMLFSGVTNTGNTYIPAMLEANGLSVNLASTVVAISVLCESPLTLFSYKFMDQLTSKKLFTFTVLLVFVQFLIYGMNLGLPSKVIMTLVAKHTSGMLFIMTNMKIVTSLVDKHYLITALSIVQLVRSLGSIVIQNLVGQLLDNGSYSIMCLTLAGICFVTLILLVFLDLPSGKEQRLFS